MTRFASTSLTTAVLIFAAAVANGQDARAAAVPSNPYAPPACVPGVPFADITCTTGFDPWIEQFGADGITAGCGGGNYCPGLPVTRDQMAVFIEKAIHGTGTWSPGELPADNTGTGAGSLLSLTTGFANTATGAYSLYSNSYGHNNTASGSHSLYSNTVGHDNTASGSESLLSNIDGNGNTATGSNSLWSNIGGERQHRDRRR